MQVRKCRETAVRLETISQFLSFADVAQGQDGRRGAETIVTLDVGAWLSDCSGVNRRLVWR
jgi:hypothetical protein